MLAEEHLYVASVARRDGRIVIKKKCPGGPVNGGTYHKLTAEVSGYSVPPGVDIKVAAWVSTLPDGRVRLRLYRDGAWVLDAIDSGLGCAPIATPGAIGIRADDVEADFDDFSVEAV